MHTLELGRKYFCCPMYNYCTSYMVQTTMSIVYCTAAIHNALVHCHYWDQQMNDCTRYAHTARHMLTPALLFPEKLGILMEGWIKLFTITGESPVVILVGVSESSHPSHRGGTSVDGETHTIMHPIPCLSLGVPRLGRGNVLGPGVSPPVWMDH